MNIGRGGTLGGRDAAGGEGGGEGARRSPGTAAQDTRGPGASRREGNPNKAWCVVLRSRSLRKRLRCLVSSLSRPLTLSSINTAPVEPRWTCRVVAPRHRDLRCEEKREPDCYRKLETWLPLA
jgi:hypothetical protein